MSDAYGGQNFAKAKKYFEIGKRLGDPTASTALARFYQYGIEGDINLQESLLLDKAGAERGDNRAMYNMGIRKFNPKNCQLPAAESIDYLTKSISGDLAGTTPLSHTQLGWMFETGCGVKQDFMRAEAEYKQAAEQNHQLADLALARLYATGDLGEVDIAKAESHLESVTDSEGPSLLQDTFWLYIPNSSFDALTRKAWADLNLSLIHI